MIYALAFLAALLAGCGYWLYRRGRQAEQADEHERLEQDMVEAKEVRENVDRMDEEELRDAARRRARERLRKRPF